LHQDAAGNIFLVGVIRDITERKRIEAELRRTAEELTRSNEELKQSENQLRYLANHDPLTGLANRKLFQESLESLLIWGKQNNKLLGLLYLDLDGFKPVNDSLGHDIGDLLLKAVAQRIKNCLRNSDVVSRLGGDEFAVILPGIKQAEDALVVAYKIADNLCKPFMLSGHNINIRVSIGSSVYPQDGQDAAKLMKKADSDMYKIKKLGKRQQLPESGTSIE
jgi:diguanylate cyclase (GGDEF)-like protein